MDYEADLEAIRAEMDLSAEDQIERKIDWLVREMDELCKLANNPETRDLCATQSIGIGQIQFRAGLILTFLDADKPRLKVVSNNG